MNAILLLLLSFFVHENKKLHGVCEKSCSIHDSMYYILYNIVDIVTSALHGGYIIVCWFICLFVFSELLCMFVSSVSQKSALYECNSVVLN